MTQTRSFIVRDGGGAFPNPDRPGKVCWPHVFDVELSSSPGRVQDIIASAARWLAANGALPVAEREPFTIQFCGEITETDENTTAEFEIPKSEPPR